MINNIKYTSYNQIIQEFDVYIMQVGKNSYQFKLVKRLDGSKPPRLTLDGVNQKVESLDKKIEGLDMKIDKLAQMMQDGFGRINQRIDKIDQRIDNLENVVIRDHNLLIETNQFLHKIIKLNNLKTK